MNPTKRLIPPKLGRSSEPKVGNAPFAPAPFAFPIMLELSSFLRLLVYVYICIFLSIVPYVECH